MLLYSNAERKKPFSISSLTKADWGEPQIACWQLPSEEIALLNFQALVYNKLWRVGGGDTLQTYTSLESSQGWAGGRELTLKLQSYLCSILTLATK